ncbi:MAG: XdhC family protein, partial [Henriciella sp.]|uniref:XdhC family protein n=1 Tax=Henriciella sp. TaxID=1968823 RepID=UPI003C773725
MAVAYTEHAEDVLSQWLGWRETGPAALVMITGTVGGAVRAPGALMAVSADGDIAGYISGGCIDADVVLQAHAALKHGQAKSLRYGAGSPFVDLPLPCGGAIDLVIEPDADVEA